MRAVRALPYVWALPRILDVSFFVRRVRVPPGRRRPFDVIGMRGRAMSMR